MSFLKAMNAEMDGEFNKSVTENGAVGYRTTGKSLLDLNFSVASLRSASDAEIIERFKLAFFEDKRLAMKWLFFARDIRGGLGERRLFRTVMNYIAEYEPGIVIKVIQLIPEYGRFDDLLGLLDIDNLRPAVLHYITSVLQEDKEKMTKGEPISLLAKWLPSANASSAKTKRYAKLIRSWLRITEKQYRNLLSKMRNYLDIVERKMSSGQWGEINYESVPSRANLIYNNAFLRNDEERRREYLSRLENGKAKINSSVLYPHDIVHKYFDNSRYGYHTTVMKYDASLEEMWKSLPNTIGEDCRTIVVADGSGSMNVKVGNTNVSAICVADALAIYFAEHLSGEFKNKYITFSSRPKLVDFSMVKSLRDKISIALSHNEVANTNIEAVFDLILNTAIHNNMGQEDIPANVLIISDMEFDIAVCSNRCRYGGVDENLFKTIASKYEEAGYKLPRLVFWNVNSRTGTIPVRENENGVALVSGFSINICKMVMSGKTDPYECLLETLNSERYAQIDNVLNNSRCFE